MCSTPVFHIFFFLSNQDDNNEIAYLGLKKSSFARFTRVERAFFISVYFAAVVVQSTGWNDLFCSSVDGLSNWQQISNLFFWSPNRSYQFKSRVVRSHFGTQTTKRLQKRERLHFELALSLFSMLYLLKIAINLRGGWHHFAGVLVKELSHGHGTFSVFGIKLYKSISF